LDATLNNKFLIFIVLGLGLAACSAESPVDPAAETDRIASEFIVGFYQQYPEEAQESGFPDAPNDRFGDHSAAGVAAWDAQVDQWLEELNAVDTEAINGTPTATTWLFTQDRLQALVDRRVCRTELWNISPTWTGWQVLLPSTFALQPVGTAAEKQAALARIADLERFIDTEITNLRDGVEAGYLAPDHNVVAVANQVTTLIEMAVDDSPYFNPAARSDDAEFVSAYRAVMQDSFLPAMRRYLDYLGDYPARSGTGVANNPNGETCYRASVRYWSSLSMDPADIHRTGLAQMSRIRTEMLAIAKETFGTDDLDAVLNELKSNPEHTFSSEEDMLQHVTAAVERSKVAVHDWFGYVPEADMVIVPYPAYEKNSGGGFYSAGAVDGSRPGIYKVGTYNPTGISRSDQESVAFHEGYPGHHMQVSIALLNQSLHPVLRYLFISGSGEGWALYTETLADEMGLYSDEISRLGMLSAEASRAARLVVDPGMHVMGWTRQQAIDYILENTTSGIDGASYEVDRYAAVPGQATSYLLGSLEIQRLRAHAETLLGERFDIKAFHDRVLENGTVTLPMLGMSIDAWIHEELAK
jgi:uncharacterized protein (DUF885 family)